MAELYEMTATEVVALLKSGEVSPSELIDVAEKRIAETNPHINALPTLCLDRARDHAADLEKSGSTDRGDSHLHGLPIAIKDLTPVKDVRFTMGSLIHADDIAEHSDIMVERLEERGGIVVAKANTPEFGAGAQTFNDVFGTTKNPWNTDMTPGGSSGGSAAALAAGQVWLAQGSDMGGSLRIPAAFSGVVGLRPSPKRVPHGPSGLPFTVSSVEGPMGRTVPDVALMLDAMVGHHTMDPMSLPTPEISYSDSLKNIPKFGKVAYSANLGQCPIDPEVAEICAKAAKDFAAYCDSVEEDCFDLSGGHDIFQVLRAAQFAASHAPKLETKKDQLKPEVIWNIEKGMNLTGEEIGRAHREQGALYQRVASFFTEYDLLICPTVMVPPFDHTIRYLEEVNGEKFDNYVAWLAMTYLLTITSCPSISIPCGFTKSGLPVGLQIMAPNSREDVVLQAAYAFERDHDYAGAVPIAPKNPS